MEAIEQGERCNCGGEVDRLYLIKKNIWQGRCFRCGKPYTVLSKEE